MSEPIKNCPYCGKNNMLPLLVQRKEEVIVSIQCQECWAQGPRNTKSDRFEALKQAHEEWNIRR